MEFANNVPMFHEGAQVMIVKVEDRFGKVAKQFRLFRAWVQNARNAAVCHCLPGENKPFELGKALLAGFPN